MTAPTRARLDRELATDQKYKELCKDHKIRFAGNRLEGDVTNFLTRNDPKTKVHKRYIKENYRYYYFRMRLLTFNFLIFFFISAPTMFFLFG